MKRKDIIRYIVMMDIVLIFVNLCFYSASATMQTVMGALLLFISCGLTYKFGEAESVRACAQSAGLAKAEGDISKEAKEAAYDRRRVLKTVLRCALVPFIISVLYLGVYGVTMHVQGQVTGQVDLEKDLQEWEDAMLAEQEDTLVGAAALEQQLLEEAGQQTAGAEDETVSEPAETDETTEAIDTEEQPVPEAEPMSLLDTITFVLRLVTYVIAMPFWNAILLWVDQYIVLQPANIAVLLLYPFVWPGMMYLGYLQGPRVRRKTEAAMARGRRRAKARSRIGQKNNGSGGTKPMF